MAFENKAYMKRIFDREHPMPQDCPLLIQPLRPTPPAPSPMPPAPRKVFTKESFLPPPMEEQKRQHEEYYRLAGLPASRYLAEFSSSGITEVVEGKAWVVPSLLSPQECQEVIRSGEEHGMTGSRGSDSGIKTPRTARRTYEYQAPWLTAMVAPRLPEELLQVLELTSPHTAVRAVHPNWRVACYGPGQAFPAHMDGSDAITVSGDQGGRKELYTSSHTLLIYLCEQQSYGGGATRLFLSGKYDQDTLDIKLPQGFGLVFQQKGMMHAGQEVHTPANALTNTLTTKYIAQAGILRAQGDIRAAPSIFKPGPGLQYETNMKLQEMEGEKERRRTGEADIEA